MSALPSKADIERLGRNVCKVPIADIMCHPMFGCFESRSIRLEINGFDHAPPFEDVGSKYRVGSFLIKVEGFKAELLEMRGHFWIF
jgi:hypothetical protein